MLYQILAWLDGKKAVILAILSLIVSYLVSIHTITAELGTLIQSIFGLLTTGAVYKTNQMGISK